MYEHEGQLDIRRVTHEKERISRLISQLDVSQTPPSERTMDMWHYGVGDNIGELQRLETKAIEELGLVVDSRYNKIAQAVSYEADGDSKAFPGFYSLFIDGPGMLQSKGESGYKLYPKEHRKTLYVGKKVHFRITYNQFIVPTRHKLCSFRFFYDRIEKKQKGVRTEEYFYEDVVMITTSMETRTFILTEQKEEFYTFIMTLKSADKIKVSLSDEGLIEMIEVILRDSIEPIYRDRVSSLRNDRSLYELDRRAQNEAKLILKNIRNQMVEIKRGTGSRERGGHQSSPERGGVQREPHRSRERIQAAINRYATAAPTPMESDYDDYDYE